MSIEGRGSAFPTLTTSSGHTTVGSLTPLPGIRPFCEAVVVPAPASLNRLRQQPLLDARGIQAVLERLQHHTPFWASMSFSIISPDTLPPVAAKYERVHSEGSFFKTAAYLRRDWSYPALVDR